MVVKKKLSSPSKREERVEKLVGRILAAWAAAGYPADGVMVEGIRYKPLFETGKKPERRVSNVFENRGEEI